MANTPDIKLVFSAEVKASTDQIKKDLEQVINNVQADLPAITLKFDMSELKTAISNIQKDMGTATSESTKKLVPDTSAYLNALRSLEQDLARVTKQQNDWSAAAKSSTGEVSQAYEELGNQKKAIQGLIDQFAEMAKEGSNVQMTFGEFTKSQAEYREEIAKASATLEEYKAKSKWLSETQNVGDYSAALAKVVSLRQQIQETLDRISTSQTDNADLGRAALTQYDSDLEKLANQLVSTGMAQNTFTSSFKELSSGAKLAMESVRSEVTLVAGTKEYSNALASLEKDLENVIKKQNEWGAAGKSSSEDARAAYGRLGEQREAIEGLITELKAYEADTSKASMSTAEFAKRQAEYREAIAQSSQELEKLGYKSRWLSKDDNTTQWFEAIKKVNDMYIQVTNTIEKYSDIHTEKSEVAINNLEKQQTALSELQKALRGTGISQQDLGEKLARISSIIAISSGNLQAEAAALDNAKKKAQEYAAAMEQGNKALLDATRTQSQYAGSRESNSAYYTSLSQNIAQINMLNGQLQNGEISTAAYREEVDKLTQSIQVNTTGLQNSASGFQVLGRQIGSIFTNFMNFGNGLTQYITMMFSAYRIIYRVIDSIRDLINRSIELEDIMVDLRIVTGMTNDEYTKYLQNISDISKETATSLDSLITATTTFSRLGYDINESSMLAKYTGMLEKVGAVDTEKAQNAVTSIMKAFSEELSVDDIETVLNKLVTVGNNFPISVEQISEAMLNASSTLAAAGNTFDQSVALLTAANATIQNASKSSTGLRTIAARLRNTKAELDELGEEVMTTAKYEELVKMLTAHKVELTDINGEYRSTYDIIKDIAAQWDEMTSMEQAALATEIAGVRQQSVFFSLVEQFQEASGAMDKMAEKTNTLEEAYSVYLDSMTAHIEQFRTAWSTLASDLVSSDAIKGIVDLGTKIIGVVDALARVNAILPTITASISTIMALNLARTFQRSQQNLNNIVATLLSTRTATESVITSVASLNNNERARLLTMIQSADARRFLTEEEERAIISELRLAEAEGAEGTSAQFAAHANYTLAASLGAVWASNPLSVIMLAATTLTAVYSATSALVNSFQKKSDSLEVVSRSISEIADEMQDLYEKTQETEKSIESIIPRFTELSKGVDAFGNNVSLTEEEYEEFHRIQNEIAEQFPQFDMGLDSNGNHMLKLEDDAKSLTDELERQLEVRRRLAEIEMSNDIDEAYSNRSDGMKNLRDDSIAAKEDLQSYYELLRDLANANIDFTSDKRANLAGKLKAYIGEDMLEELQRASNEYRKTGDDLPLMQALSDARKRLEEHIAAFDEEADGFTADQEEQIKKMLLLWAQMTPEFKTIGDDIGVEMENITSKMILNLDPTEYETGEQVKKYIEDTILKPIANASPEVKDEFRHLFDLNSEFVSGGKTVGEFSSELDTLKTNLRDSGIEIKTIEGIFEATGANGYIEKYHTLSRSIKGDVDEVKEAVNGLSANDVEIGYQIIAENGSMTLDEFNIKLEQVKLASGTMVDVFDFKDFFEGTKTLRGGMENIASAMKKLQEGTALTKNEMFKLAEQFPMLLKQSNLFTDGSIEGQKKMLKSVQDVQKQSYQAVVDAKVAELKAAKEAINSQIELEKKKVEILLEANNALIKDKLEGNIKYEKAMAKIDEIEATNYAEIKNGEVNINNAGLKAMSDATAQSAEELLGNVWIPYAEGMISTIGGAYEIMVDAAKDAYEAITAAILSGDDSGMISSSVMLARAREGDQEALDNLRSGVWKLSDKAAEIFKNSLNKQISLGRIKVLESATIDIDNIIENLEASLEDLTYTFADASNEFGRTSGSSSSSSSSSSNDPDAKYYSAIDALVAYRVKMLRAELEERKKELQEELSLAKDFADYQKKLLDRQYNEEKYRKEQEEKRKAVTDVQLEMDRLSRDNSAWAQGRLVELNEKLKGAQEKLDEFEKKEALETGKEFWETFYANKQTEINDQIDALTDILADNTDFQQQAYSELMSGTTKFANTIYDYARKNETSMDSFYKMFRNVYDAILALQNEDAGSVWGNSTSVWWAGDGLKWLWALLTDPNNYSFSGARYAAGTPNATAGWHRVNEIGAEALFTSVNGKQYRLFSGGERVLDAESTSFLYELAKSRGANLAQTISQTYQSVSARPVPSVVNMGNIVINGNADERTVSQIRRAQRDSVASLLKEFGRLAR